MGNMKNMSGRRAKTATLCLLAAFLVSTLYVPIVAADEIVGVVYRGWSDDECAGTFTYSVSGASLGTDVSQYREFKGPLIETRTQEASGCYCDGKYIMDVNKNKCIECHNLLFTPHYEPTEIGYVTEKGVYDKKPILYKGEDVGCRCRLERANMVLNIDKAEKEGVCDYVARKPGDELCAQKYADGDTTVAGVCAATEKDDSPKYLGFVTDQTGKDIKCCCKGEAEARDGPIAGKKICVGKSDLQKEKDAACKNKFGSYGANVEACDDQTDEASTKEGEKYIGVMIDPKDNTKLIQCCCEPNYKNVGTACIPSKPSTSCGR